MGKLIPNLLLASLLAIAACGPPYPVPRRNVPTARTDPQASPELAKAQRAQPSQRKEAHIAR
jgi:hypothetical protein